MLFRDRRWVRDGSVLFVAFSLWVPVMAFGSTNPTLSAGRVVAFELVVAALCFGLAAALAAIRTRRPIGDLDPRG